MRLCGCGCGEPVAHGRRFVQHHHLRGGNPERQSYAQRGEDHHAWRRQIRQEARGYKTPCLVTHLKPRADGYVRVLTPSGQRYAHRVAWEDEYGRIPADLEIDHECYQRDCVNTDHMELVTRAENCRRRRDRRVADGPYLVTGAAGFLGGAVADELEAAGHAVIRTDREHGDLTDEAEVFRIVKEVEPSRILHFAAQVGRQFCEDNPGWAIEANVTMSAFVAKAAAWIGAELTYCSTSEVYGERGDEIAHEYDELGTPTGVYALTKRWAEDAVRLYAPPSLKIIRPSMPYGPGAPPGRGRRAIDNMLWQAHHGMEIPVHAGAMRSWCWLGDLVRGIRLIVEEGDPGPYNVGRDDAEVSMRRVADLAVELAGASPSLIRQELAPPRQTVVKRLSTQRLRSLGWRPEVDLEDGMRQLYEWIKNFDEHGDFVGGRAA